MPEDPIFNPVFWRKLYRLLVGWAVIAYLKTPFGKKWLKRIPFVINNRDRVSTLKLLVDRLKIWGFNNIIILDNDSAWPELAEYYQNCDCSVVYLRRNAGYLALWNSLEVSWVLKGFYVYTDPDVLPINECPSDFLRHFMQELCKRQSLDKIGFGIKIDDIPDSYSRKSEVIAHESKFWEKEAAPGLFEAPIDTTFALYRPGVGGGYWLTALRTGFPYVVRHLPWYVDSSNLSKEEVFYSSRAKADSSWNSKTT